MDPDQQLAITLSFMQAISPVIARYHTQRLVKELENEIRGSRTPAELARQVATDNAKMTVEFAVYLTAQFASLDAALNTETENRSQSQNPVAPGEQGTGEPPAGVQSFAAGVLAGTYPVSDLRRDRH